MTAPNRVLHNGVYPASVTPLTSEGKLCEQSLERLLVRFRSDGCAGVVLAGTNGEGPSLSRTEKLNLIRSARACSDLPVIAGVATNSVGDAIELCSDANEAGAIAALVMPPAYFRESGEAGIEAWFRAVLDESALPILAYNLPQRTGITLSAGLLGRLSDHQRFLGAKDSSGNRENLSTYAATIPNHPLFVGDETLLHEALAEGWSGTISGAANVIGGKLVEVVQAFFSSSPSDAAPLFEATLPRIKELRSIPQPMSNKEFLFQAGVLSSGQVKPPLQLA